MKIAQTLTILSTVFCIATAASAFAQEASVATFHIELENSTAQSIVNPIITSPITNGQVAFRIINNTGKQAFFVSGSDDTGAVPMVSENTFTVPYVEGAQYKVVDRDGEIIATWQLQNPQATVQSASSAESQARYDEWGRKLQSVIQSNQAVSVSTYQQSTTQQLQNTQQVQVTRQPAAPVQEDQVIRGYW